MKKNILIVCTTLIIFSLTACGQSQTDTPTNETEVAAAKTVAFENTFLTAIDRQINPNLFYKVDSRFIANISKKNLHNAKTIIDILPKEATKTMESYQNVTVSILGNEGEITEIGINEVLNEAQLKLLQSADYSSNIHISATCKESNGFGRSWDYDLVYYMTVIPEKEAEFTYGQEALIEYLKANSKSKTTVIRADKLQPCRINFTISKEGKITNVKLDATSGYPSVDEALIDLLINMPQTWIPATNAKGEKINQELVFFFGMEGC
jgi:hypothetical protein